MEIAANHVQEARLTCDQLHVADTYLVTHDLLATATDLGMEVDEVERVLAQKPVIRYIDRIFNEAGYRNKGKLFDLLDKIIESKLEEAEETEMYTDKDLLDVLATLHKMKLAEMQLQIKLAEVETKVPSTQINVQNNNYSALLESLMK